MALTKWDPFQGLFAAQHELGRLFDRAFGLAAESNVTWAPAVDVYEETDKLIVKADLPGVNPESIEVKVTPTHLTIKGTREEQKEVKKEQFYRLERSYGSFKRVIPLPDDVKQEEVKASYNKGVLEISLPRAIATKPKEIKVEVKGK